MRITRSTAVKNGEAVIRSTHDRFLEKLDFLLQEFKKRAQSQDWAAIHFSSLDLVGEAGTLGWPIIGEAAGHLHKITAKEDHQDLAESVRICINSMELMRTQNLKVETPLASTLNASLERLSQKIAGAAHV